MPIEKSAGAVIFRKESSFAKATEGKDGKIYYLLLHYPSSAKAPKPRSRVNSLRGRDYWDFPKGHIEKGEKEIDTVKREVFEETGLKDIKFVEGFKEWIKYFFKHKGKNVFKIVTFLLAEAETEEVKISPEHIGYKWLPYKEALKQLKFKNAREILKKANDFLSKEDI